MSMSFLFNVVGDTSEHHFHPGTIYFYNGDINEIQGVHNPEELKYLGDTYKTVTGRDLKLYSWGPKTGPVHTRIFGVLKPGSHTAEIQNALRKLQEETKKYIEIYGDPKWFTPQVAMRIRTDANLTSETIGISYPGEKFEVLDAFTACDYHWAKINYTPKGATKSRIAYIAMGHIDGTEYGIKG